MRKPHSTTTKRSSQRGRPEKRHDKRSEMRTDRGPGKRLEKRPSARKPSPEYSDRPRERRPDSHRAERRQEPLSGGEIRELRARQIREQEKITKFYGVQACRAIATERSGAIHRVFVSEQLSGSFRDLKNLCISRQIPFRTAPLDEIARVAGTEHHEGICIEGDPVATLTGDELELRLPSDRPSFVVYLENVENPHNAGALLRTAAFFGADGAILQAREMKSLSGALCRVAEGAAERLPIVLSPDPGGAMKRLVDIGYVPVATTPHKARSIYTFPWPERVILMLGAEGPGLSERAMAMCQASVSIPRFGEMESLNVAAATSALLVELRRSWIFSRTRT